MLNKKRNPLRKQRFNSVNLEVHNAKKYIETKQDPNELASFLLDNGLIPASEFPTNPMVETFEILGSVLNDLGLSRANDYFMVDLHEVYKYSLNIGSGINSVPHQSRTEIQTLLMHIFDREHFPDHSQEAIILQNRIRNIDDDTWEKYDESQGINIVGHHASEGMQCPECGTVYYDPSEITFILSSSIMNVRARLTTNPDDDIKTGKPYSVLVPICTICYCDSVEEGLSETGLQPENISPYTIGTGNVYRKTIPLLPECMADQIETEANSNRNLNSILFWPSKKSDAICALYRASYKHNKEKKDDTNKE